jgi:hypothetical protein
MELILVQTDSLFRQHPYKSNVLKIKLLNKEYFISKNRLKISNFFDSHMHRNEMIMGNNIACIKCFELFVKLLTKDRFILTYSELLILLHFCIRLNVSLEVKEFLKNLILINLKTGKINSENCQHFNYAEVLNFLGLESKGYPNKPVSNKNGYRKLNPESFLFYQSVFGPHLNRVLNRQRVSRLDDAIVEQSRLHFSNKGFYKYVELFFTKMNNKNVENTLGNEKIDENYKLVEINPVIKITSSRFIINELNTKFVGETNLAILLQKNIRRFLAQKKYFQVNQERIKTDINSRILTIQKNVRRFLILKALKKFSILQQILETRNKAAKVITKLIKTFFTKKTNSEKFLLNKITSIRKTSALLLQKTFRAFILYKKVKEILFKEKNYYSLTYPFKAKRVLLKIFISEEKEIKEKIYEYIFCPVRDMFVLYINPLNLPSGKYRVLLIVDDIITCDGRYPHIEFSDGHYYNIIEFRLFNKNTIQLTDTEDTKNNTSIDQVKRDSLITNSNESDMSFMLSTKERNGSFDRSLIKNLMNKEACSYLEIIKDCISEDFHGDNDY